MPTSPFWIAVVSALGVVGASLIAWRSSHDTVKAADRREAALREQLACQRSEEREERSREREHARELARMQHDLDLERLSQASAEVRAAEARQFDREAHLAALSWLHTALELGRDIEMPDSVEQVLVRDRRAEVKSLLGPLELQGDDRVIHAFDTAVDHVETVWQTFRSYRAAWLNQREDEAMYRQAAADARLRANDSVRRYRELARESLL